MLAEALAAAVVGAVALWLVLQPLIRPRAGSVPSGEPIDPEETPKGIALAALKEIEFDRETGKLSDRDYEFLKAKYTAAALEALRGDGSPVSPTPVPGDIESMIAAKVRALRSASASTPPDAIVRSPSASPSCPSCGPRPEPDSVFCSSCGRRLSAHAACDCGAALLPGGRFCESCGRLVAA